MVASAPLFPASRKEFRESSSSFDVRHDLGLADDLFGVGRPVREFQGPVGSDVHRTFGYRRCADVHEYWVSR